MVLGLAEVDFDVAFGEAMYVSLQPATVAVWATVTALSCDQLGLAELLGLVVLSTRLIQVSHGNSGSSIFCTDSESPLKWLVAPTLDNYVNVPYFLLPTRA